MQDTPDGDVDAALTRRVVNLRDGGNSNLLHVAARHGAVDVLRLLCSLGGATACNAENSAGYTPMHLAAASGESVCSVMNSSGSGLPNFTVRHVLTAILRRYARPFDM